MGISQLRIYRLPVDAIAFIPIVWPATLHGCSFVEIECDAFVDIVLRAPNNTASNERVLAAGRTHEIKFGYRPLVGETVAWVKTSSGAGDLVFTGSV